VGMRAIFKNAGYEREISDKGYAVISGLLNASACDELTAFFAQHDVVDDRAFTISNWNNNTVYRNATFDKITETLLPLAENLLENYRPVLAVYTAKRPQANSDMLLHQDWSLVEETKFRSVSIWVALCDMDEANGNLQVAPYSHLYAGFPRGMNVPVPFEEIRQKMHERHLINVPLKKGDAVVFDHRLIHASPPNKTRQIRLAAVLALVPFEAPLVHYYKPLDSQDELELLTMDASEFRTIDFFDVGKKPKHTGSLGKITAAFNQLKEEDILRPESL
jgi:ectoine hydroxylase-related dioxygenase (phytanoyl-CoA dioxygenase family)